MHIQPDLAGTPAKVGPYRLQYPGGSIDLERGTVSLPGSPRTLLAQTELSALRVLVQRAGTTVLQEELAALLWPDDPCKTRNSVQAVISRVRKLLATLGERAGIRTIYGIGYQWTGPAPCAAPLGPPANELRAALARGGVVVVGRGADRRPGELVALVDRLTPGRQRRWLTADHLRHESLLLPTLETLFGLHPSPSLLLRMRISAIRHRLAGERGLLVVLERLRPELVEVLRELARPLDLATLGVSLLVTTPGAPCPGESLIKMDAGPPPGHPPQGGSLAAANAESEQT